MSDALKPIFGLSPVHAGRWEVNAHPDDLRGWSVIDIAKTGFSALELPLPDPTSDELPDNWEHEDWDVMLDLGREAPWYPKVMFELHRHGGSIISFLCRDLEELSEEQVEDRSHTVLARHGFTVHQVTYDNDGYESFFLVRSQIREHTHRVADVWDAALDLSAALTYPILPLNCPKQEVLHALQAGALDALIGLRESALLEFKSTLPDLTHSVGKIELAKDVAQFANSPNGGLLLYGIRTKNDGKGDVAKKIVPLSMKPRQLDSIRGILDDRIYPSIQELSIEPFNAAGGHLLLIEVPPQANELKPFIVEGAVVEGTDFGNSFLIPQRRGDRIVPVSGREIHGLIAGRLFRVERDKNGENPV